MKFHSGPSGNSYKFFDISYQYDNDDKFPFINYHCSVTNGKYIKRLWGIKSKEVVEQHNLTNIVSLCKYLDKEVIWPRDVYDPSTRISLNQPGVFKIKLSSLGNKSFKPPAATQENSSTTSRVSSTASSIITSPSILSSMAKPDK